MSAESEPVILINEDGAAFSYVRNWYEDHQSLYNYLLENIEWEQMIGNTYGKQYLVPRLNYHMGDDDLKSHPTYGGSTISINPWLPRVSIIRDALESGFECKINSCIVNYYRDGNDYIAFHGDKESLGLNNMTIGVALGATRDLVFKRNKDGHTVKLENRAGDLYVMEGTIHKLWKHSVPIRKKVKEGRISITFRQIASE